jgi:hypothetical protein
VQRLQWAPANAPAIAEDLLTLAMSAAAPDRPAE